MLSVTDARNTILGEVTPLAAREVPVGEALDCVLAADIHAAVALPAWDNSAVDGYAVRATDLVGANENNPLHLRVQGELPAGQAATQPVEAHSCLRIFTGAPLPPGADAVLMQEDTRPHHPGYVAVVESVETGENIRRQGEDVALGAVVLRTGTRLRPLELAMAAAVGLAKVPVRPRPRVGVLVTGAEIVEPGQPVREAQIYNSNGVLLSGLLARAGCTPVDLGIADDTKEAIGEKLDYGLSECDVVITVGGVSVGAYDLVKEVLLEQGCEQKFWTVAMKPGKPVVFGRRGAQLVFGLPGNPVSAAVTFLILVRPALLKLRGLTELELPAVMAVAGADFVNHGERVHYMRARLVPADKPEGKPSVRPLERQGSHVISSLTEADCLVEVPGCRTISKGAEVKAMRLE